MNRTLAQSTRVKLNRCHHEMIKLFYGGLLIVYVQGAVHKGYQWKQPLWTPPHALSAMQYFKVTNYALIERHLCVVATGVPHWY